MHSLTNDLFTYLCKEQLFAITHVQHEKMDSIIRSYFFRDELRFRAERAIASVRQASEDNGFPLPPDRALEIVIEEAVKLYGER